MSDTINIYSHTASTIKIDTEMHIYQDLYDHFAFRPAGYKFNPKFKARIWDGFIRLMNIRARTLPLGLLSRLQKYAEQSNATLDFSCYTNKSGDENVTYEEIEEFAESLNIHSGGNKITPHDYQLDAVFKAIQTGRLVALAPTSAGKSLILYIFLNWFRLKNPETKLLLIVPSVALVHQMYSDFVDYSSHYDEKPDQYTHLIMSGKEKQAKVQLTISTWQSLQNIAKGKDKTYQQDYFQQFDVVACDEVHSAKSKVLSQILDLCTNAYTRLGVTGTLDGTDCMAVQLEGIFGEIYTVTTTRELMDRGAVSQMDIKCLLLNYPEEVKKLCKDLKYQEEIDFVISHPGRLKFTANLALNVKGNTLVLYNLVEKHGKPLYDLIKAKAGDRKVFFIHGNVSGEERNEMRAIMESEDNAIIIGSYGCMSTGVSIKRLHNVIFSSPSKSQIRVLQSLGRGLRLGNGKSHCTLYDIGDDLSYKKHKNYTLLHCIERIKMYSKQQLDYKLIKVDIK